MNKKPKIILMCGLPRSGKSTWIEKNKSLGANAVVICPDRVRLKVFGVQFYRPVEQFVWGVTNGFANLLLEQGKDIIIDATNINHRQRNVWFNVAADYGSDVSIVWFKTSADTCKKRSAESDSSNRVPDSVIEKMAVDFEDPFYAKSHLCDDGKSWLNVELTQVMSNGWVSSGEPGVKSNYYLPELTRSSYDKYAAGESNE